jgi:hypothetical protein
MTSILAPQNGDDAGLVLTTVTDESSSDRGIYLRLFGARAWRLPLNERIAVTRGENGLTARHDMWFVGRRFLRLSYRMHVTATFQQAIRKGR